MIIISPKRRYKYEIKDFLLVGFLGTEIEKNVFHYEEQVPIFAELECNIIGHVFHRNEGNVFSFSSISQESIKAIFKAHKKLRKDLDF